MREPKELISTTFEACPSRLIFTVQMAGRDTLSSIVVCLNMTKRELGYDITPAALITAGTSSSENRKKLI